MKYVPIMLLVTASLCFAQTTSQETTVETTPPFVDENGTLFAEPVGNDTFLNEYEKIIWGLKSKLEESEAAAAAFLTLQYKILTKSEPDSKEKLLAAFDKRSDEFKFKDKDAARKLITDKLPSKAY